MENFNPPNDGMVSVTSSFDEYVKNERENSPYFNKLPTGEYIVKFLGAEMVSTPFGITPRYRFVVNGQEKQLDSKAQSLHVLAGRQGQTMTIVKSLSKDGKNSYFVR